MFKYLEELAVTEAEQVQRVIQALFRQTDGETEFAIEADTGKRISFDFSGLVLESE